MDQEQANQILRELYYNPKSPGSFGGVQALYKAARATGNRVSLQNVKKFLQAQTTYQRHSRVYRIHAASDRFIAKEPFHLWQGDLAEYKLPPYRFILVVVDSFSKMAFFEPLKTKSGPEMVRAFQKILRRARPPNSKAVKFFLTDRGKEFYNASMLQLYADEGIKHYSIAKASDYGGGAAMAERMIRTLGDKLERYETEYNIADPVQLLHDIEDSLNGTVHSATRMTPKEIHLPAYQRHAMDPLKVLRAGVKGDVLWDDGKMIVARELMNTTTGRNKRPHQWDDTAHEKLKGLGQRLTAGDFVRLYGEKSKFQKGRKPGYTEEVFRVVRPLKHNPNKYLVEGEGADKVIGSFYRSELLKLPEKPKTYPVRIIKKRKYRGQDQLFVQWLTEPNTKPQWIPARSLNP
jgi:hypothetical protein